MEKIIGTYHVREREREREREKCYTGSRRRGISYVQ